MNTRRGALVWLFLATALGIGACGRPPAASPGAPGVAGASVSPPAHILISPHGRPSARASADSWGSSSTAADQGKGTGLWSGAGRHPQWRGCQHSYDPEMTAFLFGTAATPSPAP